jgi:phospholipid-binding lipoprotein MlaA
MRLRIGGIIPTITRTKPVSDVRAANRHLRLLLAGALIVLAGCATPPTDPAGRAEFDATNDRFEPMNRFFFGFNDWLDTLLFKPVAQSYVFVFPQFSRNMMRHFLDNLNEPVIFADDIMQGEFHRADITMGRFTANTTFGFGGLFDIATSTGLPEQTGDFGQTLYHYGFPEGPYLVLPILGPSNPRDAIGIAADGEMDPFGWLASHYGHGGATWYRYIAWGADERARNIDTINDIKKNSLDYYAQMRSLFRQHRAAELRNGQPAPVKDLNSLYIDPGTRSQTSLDLQKNKQQ